MGTTKKANKVKKDITTKTVVADATKADNPTRISIPFFFIGLIIGYVAAVIFTHSGANSLIGYAVFLLSYIAVGLLLLSYALDEKSSRFRGFAIGLLGLVVGLIADKILRLKSQITVFTFCLAYVISLVITIVIVLIIAGL